MSIPPSELLAGDDFVGFQRAGQSWADVLTNVAGIKPTDRVLDVGCGAGRLALAMTTYLDRSGIFEGVDPNPAAVEWAADAIAGNYPNFRFRKRALTNPLPFADTSFDAVVVSEEMTHRLPRQFEALLAETARVLRVGGKLLLGMYLLSSDVAEAIQTGQSRHAFPYRDGECAVQDKSTPELAVGYEQSAAVERFNDQGLALVNPPERGRWLTGGRGPDVVVLRKVRHASWVGKMLKIFRPEPPADPQFVLESTYARAA